ncbi:MAG: 6-pyruvoyl-tetrahydropterin synthase-related protein [bacterium]
MQKLKKLFSYFIVLIISIPALLSLLNNSYFSMHDDQHMARLFLFNKGLIQGSLFPRWVDTLGFSFGYPLFNFYPPAIYYISEFFHIFGLSLIWSIKLMIITGFILSGLGMFLFAKKRIGLWGGLIAATLYNYSFYHAVLVYVRGDFAEFFSLALLPFIFLTFENLWETPNFKNSAFFSIAFALLTLTHTLIAFPTIFFLAIFSIFYLFKKLKNKIKSLIKVTIGGVLGLGLSAFFWLPSMLERKHTILDKVFPTELSNYQLHFVCPQQFFYSLWGYGGSIAGCADGITFQLGKIHIALFLLAAIMSAAYLFRKKKYDNNISFFFLYSSLTLLTIFMTTKYSQLVWDGVPYFQYMQFPWRFLGFVTFFISISSAFFIYIFLKLFRGNRWKGFIILFSLGIICFTSLYYKKYFQPDKYIVKTDKQLTSFNEIAWRVSRSSFDFLPVNIPTTKSELNTTIPAITKKDLKTEIYNISSGKLNKVNILKNTMKEKQFKIEANDFFNLGVNTFNFPGWKAYLNNKEISINSDNQFKLISVEIPKGRHNLHIIFEDTLIRQIAKAISLISVVAILYIFLKFKFKEVKS